VSAQERIAVVGAGIVGTAVAFELSRRGARVTVLESRTLGGGATQASAGLLAPYAEAHAGGPLFDLTVRGLAAYDAFVAEVRAASPLTFEYRNSGTLEIADTHSRLEELRVRMGAPWARTAGLAWLAPSELRARTPYLREDALGALWCGSHGHVAVGAFTQAIADGAKRLGAVFEWGRQVTSIDPGTEAIRIVVSGEPRMFDRAVLCAGAWAPSLDPIGSLKGRITPVRGQLIRLALPDLQLPHVVWGACCYIVPWEDGTLLVGATSEDVGFDERTTLEGVRRMLVAAEELVPRLSSATFDGVRVGLRPATGGGVPILGPSRDPRILYAAGHFRNGVLLAPLTARVIGDYVFGGAMDPAFSAI
jgi:glycine oxidase